MNDRITVHRDGKNIYDIVLKSSFDQLAEEVSHLKAEGQKFCVVTDSHVAPLYLDEVMSCLSSQGRVDSFVFPAGEAQKNLNTVRELYRFLIQKRYDRNDILVALGGGVVGDLCGFGAATFLVYTSTKTLLTLSEEQYISGMGEIIKHGLIKNREYYQWIQKHAEQIKKRDSQTCLEMILESDKIKRDVVEKDPMEKGERALLNFGHTLGHAVEKLMDFQMLHGQCVALGCVGAAWLSAKRNLLPQQETEDICKTFQTFGLPINLKHSGLEEQAILEATKSDKKMDAGMIKFILLHKIGEAFVDRTVTDKEILDTVKFLSGGIYGE